MKGPSMQEIQLDQDEHITLTCNRHWINLAPPIVSSAVLLIAGVAVAYLSGRYHGQIGTLEFPKVIPVLIGLILAVFAGGLTALSFWVYRRNQLILTNKHLIKVEQDGLFARKVSQLSLGRVQDVNGSRRGLVATILNFGNVELQTAGEQEEFVFVQMPDPAGLANKLVRAHDEFADRQDGTENGASARPASAPVTPTAPTPTPVEQPPAPTPLEVPIVAADPQVEEPVGPPPAPSTETPPLTPAAQPPVERSIDEEQIAAPEPQLTMPPPPPAVTPEPPNFAGAPSEQPASHELTENQTVEISPPEQPPS